VTAALGCSGEQARPASADADPVVVDTVVAELEAIPETAVASGGVEPWRRVSPGSKIMGRVDSVPVRQGDRVQAGQVLARLESRDLEAAVAQAEAAVAMAEAQLANASAQYERMQALHERGSVTDKNLEDATAGFRVAEAGLHQAEANLAAARVALGYAEIRSPVAGWVVARRVEAGDMAAPGQPLFSVEDLARVKVVVQVPETQVVGMAEGDIAAVTIDVLGRSFDARVDRVIPAGDAKSRTFEVKVTLDNPDGAIKSGMFARARFEKGTRQALLVPSEAVVTRGQMQGLLLVADGRARLRWIRVGREEDGRVEVISGLEAGDSFISPAPHGMADGAPVRER
jgi:RND family efflux transporter MFP subunit